MTYLEKQNTDCLKGLCAIAVVISHLCSQTGIGSSLGLGAIYSALGYLAVSVFFALSGYGLAFSYNRTGGGYLSTFIRVRVLPIYVLYCSAIVLYAILRFIMGVDYSLMDLAQSFFLGNTIVPYGWYFQVIILFYLLFYVAYKYCKKQPLLFISVATVVYMIGCGVFGLSTTWYECALCFDVGFLFFHKKEAVKAIYESKQGYIIACVTSIILFCICFVLGSKNLVNSSFLTLLFKICSAVLFVVCAFTLVNKVNLKNKTTHWLSKYYLEIYLFQGMVYMLCRNRFWTIENQYIYFTTAILGVLFVSWLLHPVMSKLMDAVKMRPKLS